MSFINLEIRKISSVILYFIVSVVRLPPAFYYCNMIELAGDSGTMVSSLRALRCMQCWKCYPYRSRETARLVTVAAFQAR